MHAVIVQGVGYLALAFVLLSFQRKNRIAILITMLIGVSLFVIHYALLGAWTGSMMNLIEACVVFVSYKKETKKWAANKAWPYILSLAYILAGLLTAHQLTSYLPVVAQIFGAIAVWQTNPRRIRYIMLVPRPLWFTYNFLVHSQAGIVAEIFIFLSVITGIIRFDILKQGPKTKRA